MKKLSREEMKNVMGGVNAPGSEGGTCCWHSLGWEEYECGISRADAQASATGGIKWCCAHCPTAYTS